MAKADCTPMMQQYLDIKENYKDCILFFRLGDFYEMFFEDAEKVSAELGLTLTGKDCGMKERAPMCGVPFHSADSHIADLIARGYRVAICEQTEDPKLAKGLVKREVIRIVTPGTVLDTNVLDEGKNNYIMCIYENGDQYGISLCDVSTGEFLMTETKGENKVIDEIAKFLPAEIISNKKLELETKIEKIFSMKVYEYCGWAFEYQTAYKNLCSHFKVLNLNGYGVEKEKNCVSAAGALLEYLLETQKNNLSHISSVKKYSEEKFMILDISSRKNLELTQTIRSNEKKGSLLWVLDKTRTAMGARLIRKWIEQPLIDKTEINKRLDAVGKFKEEPLEREELKEYLASVYDMERLIGKVVFSSANARDLTSLKLSLTNLPYIKRQLDSFPCSLTEEMKENLDTLDDIYKLIDDTISEDAPFSVREGGMIKDNCNEQLDKLREAKGNGSDWLADLEAKEKEATGIKNLKVRFNKVFGYFIEVTNSYLSLVPDRYIRKQTLTGAERYITPELKEIEDTILGADEKIVELEYEIFVRTRDKVAENIARIQTTAEIIAQIDVLQSLGEVADKQGYCRPDITDDGIIEIKSGRHPVVELTSRSGFIANDSDINLQENRLSVITGPNMAGKSTYMRQVALLVLMAQMGSFIPAESAAIGISDRIFTRVGASDDLATGQSTFMIEMSEVANILNNATKKSLLILDEIGRGTSTFDGLSIAWAVLEYIADKNKIGARTLFATHYHELAELEGRIEGVKNLKCSVEEKGKDVVFLRKIVRGSADHSYGVHVARLAGVPEEVLKRADIILERLEEQNGKAKKKQDEVDYTKIKPAKRPVVFVNETHNEIFEELKNTDLNKMTPIEAWQKLFEIKEKIIQGV